MSRESDLKLAAYFERRGQKARSHDDRLRFICVAQMYRERVEQDEARTLILGLPEAAQHCNAWQRAVDLMLIVAEGR